MKSFIFWHKIQKPNSHWFTQIGVVLLDLLLVLLNFGNMFAEESTEGSIFTELPRFKMEDQGRNDLFGCWVLLFPYFKRNVFCLFLLFFRGETSQIQSPPCARVFLSPILIFLRSGPRPAREKQNKDVCEARFGMWHIERGLFASG